jgi:hypothetical protein
MTAMGKAPEITVQSALFSRNGIGGRPFHAGIVDNPFGFAGGDDQGPYLVVSLNQNANPELASPGETFVLRLQDIVDGNLVSAQRGDNVTPATLQAVRDLESANLDALLAGVDTIA